MTKDMSQLSPLTFLPCTVVGSWSTHTPTMETILQYLAVFHQKIKFINVCKIFDQNLNVPSQKQGLARIKAFFEVPMTVYTVNCILFLQLV